ncbi:MAG: hydroxyisourate hydrolase [Sporichthyaceae bacterium]
MSLSTHVLDTAAGRPACGMTVLLDTQTADGTWAQTGAGTTDDDGRLRLPDPDAGVHRLVFATGDWYAAANVPCFHPRVTVEFLVLDPSEHHHVPLLLSPFAYSTYRGS